MFRRASIASTSARTSGSEVGNGPAPCCSASGAHSAGQLRLRSSPSSAGAIGIVTPSQVRIVPSGSKSEELALDVVRPATDQDARVVRVRLPGAVRVAHPHEEDASVAVDVLAVQAVDRLVDADTAGGSSGASVRPRALPPAPSGLTQRDDVKSSACRARA